jgi:hypothetical protein
MPATSAKQLSEFVTPHRISLQSRELLYAIAQHPDQLNAKRIEGLARNVENWDAVLEVARQHRVLPLVCWRLISIEAPLPVSALERLNRAYHRNVFHYTANAAELIAILKAFDADQIRAMPFKGIILGATIYNDPCARYAGDLDILIDRENLLPATAILLERGYTLTTPVHKDGSPALLNSYEYHFERPQDGMVVELRWRLELTQPRYRRNIGLQWVWPNRMRAQLAGVEVPNMDPETTLLVLSMHGSKHVWSRLVWISDVAHLLARHPDLDWERAAREAKRQGLWRPLALGVLLAHNVCSAQIPRSALEGFNADATARSLARSIEDLLFDKPGELPTSRVPYNVKLLGFQDRLKLFLSPALFRPNELDLNFVRLPGPFKILYPLVRPLRVLRDKSAR